jgi:hypothetical protein
VVASGILFGIVHCLLEHGAVYDAHRTSIAAPTDAHVVTSLEAVVTAHMGTVATGHAAGQREGVSQGHPLTRHGLVFPAS